jgi:glycosyltransferase involved in cell wall biosynthesis
LATYHATIKRWGLHDRVLFLPPRQDVEFYYAAADAYVGPSLEDAFSLPPLEGMAYGLPVIVSCHSGVSEIITHGVDGFILKDPQDAEELARLIRFLYENSDLRHRMGENASQTAKQYTWEKHTQKMHETFLLAAKDKGQREVMDRK